MHQHFFNKTQAVKTHDREMKLNQTKRSKEVLFYRHRPFRATKEECWVNRKRRIKCIQIGTHLTINATTLFISYLMRPLPAILKC
jgi:hypothetical protein